MPDVWVRPEMRNSDKQLITPTEFGMARGMEATAMAARLKRYADKAPQVVRVSNGRRRYYVESELEKFLEDTSSTTPRSAGEVAYAEIVYLEQMIQEGEAGLKNHDTYVESAEATLRKAQATLEKRKAARRKASNALTRKRKGLEIARARMSLSD